MKNIYILPTDKPSRLFIIDKSKMFLSEPPYLSFSTVGGRVHKIEGSEVYQPQHIYITSDEEIKDGEYCITKTNEVIRFKKSYTQGFLYKKITLTDNQDLIKDGVQAIDDEFLKWFVKNPSCISVETSFACLEERQCICKSNENCLKIGYKIIIPNLEVWKDIPDFEGYYQVSNLGNVKSLERYVKGKVENRLQKENILSKRLVGDKGNQYYAVTLCNNKDRKQIKVSVLVAMAFLNHIPNGYVGFTVDHIDNNPLNNNVNNLQVITKRENSSKDRKGISKYTGVTFNKKSNKWRSQIWIDGKNKALGSFDDELEAHRAYQKELQQHLKS
jgi:hypothetical protein